MNGEVKFKCGASPDYTSSYKWFFKRKELKTQPDSGIKIKKYSFLKIKNVTSNHQGFYRCQMTNAIGVAEEIYTLIVKGILDYIFLRFRGMRLHSFSFPFSFQYSHSFSCLTHFMPLVSFYAPWKHQKTFGFLMFSGGIEKDRGIKWVKGLWKLVLKIAPVIKGLT